MVALIIIGVCGYCAWGVHKYWTDLAESRRRFDAENGL